MPTRHWNTGSLMKSPDAAEQKNSGPEGFDAAMEALAAEQFRRVQVEKELAELREAAGNLIGKAADVHVDLDISEHNQGVRYYAVRPWEFNQLKKVLRRA